jgi:hypothetical protein
MCSLSENMSHGSEIGPSIKLLLVVKLNSLNAFFLSVIIQQQQSL